METAALYQSTLFLMVMREMVEGLDCIACIRVVGDTIFGGTHYLFHDVVSYVRSGVLLTGFVESCPFVGEPVNGKSCHGSAKG